MVYMSDFFKSMSVELCSMGKRNKSKEVLNLFFGLFLLNLFFNFVGSPQLYLSVVIL